MKNRKYPLLVLAIAFSLQATAQTTPATPPAPPKITANPESILGAPGQVYRADDIPSGEDGYFYTPGAAAAADSVPTAYYGNTFKFGAGYKLGLNRQCGDLNPFKNMTKQIQANVKEKIEEFKSFAKLLPSLIMSSAFEYALAKVNPELYQLTQLNIDEYFDLFEINVKSCEQVRSDLLRNGKDADGFDKIFQIAIGEEWKRMIGGEGDDGFVNSRDIQQKVAQRAAKNGVTMADGKAYGGEGQEPINFVKSLSVAGLNIITGNNSTGAWEGDINNADGEKPVAKYFKNGKELYEFLEEIYGSSNRRLNADGKGGSTAVEARAGMGIGRKYSDMRNKNLVALRRYATREITREAFEKETGILIPPAVMDDIRRAEPYQRATLLEDKAKQEAINELTTRLHLAADALRAGISAPDMVQSGLYGVAREEYEKLYFMMLDDIARLENSRYR